jgi:HAD superfamily hydrolase (TIGR01509 family)
MRNSSRTFFHFDLDGTLADTLEVNHQAYKSAVEAADGIWTKNATKLLKSGAQAQKFLLECLNLPQTKFNEVSKIKKEYFLLNVHKIKPIVEGLELLINADGMAALVTNSSRASTEAVIRFLEIESKFSHLVTSEDVSQHKPEPDPYLLSVKIAESKFNLKLKHIAVEDSKYGRLSAKSAGLEVIKIGKKFQVKNLKS